MPMLPDETLEDFDARLRAEHEARTAPPPVHPRDQTPAERAAALAPLLRPPRRAAPVVVGGRLARDCSPAERAAALSQLRHHY